METMTKKAQKEQERREACDRLRRLFDGRERKTVYTVLRSVSSSGMSRNITLKMVDDDGRLFDITYWACQAMGETCRDFRGWNVVRVNGCGMDMGFHVVSSLSWYLYNGRSERPDYVLSHEWA